MSRFNGAMKVRPVCVWLCVFMATILCGCRSARPVVSQTPSAPPQAPVLAPMPDYPEERTGWNTNATLVIFSNPDDPQGLSKLGEALAKALRQRGYRVVDGLGGAKSKGTATYADTDWLAADWRRQAKLIILSGTRGWGSAGFEGNNHTDMCMQVLVVDHPYDGFNLSLAVPSIRTFHVWSRAAHPDKATWDQVYPLHAPILAENLMRMPGFRTALERTPSSTATSLPCPKPPPMGAPPAATAAAVASATVSDADDHAMVERLVGTWEERVVAHIKTIAGKQERATSTSETAAKTVYRMDGRFNREVRMGDAAPKTFEGTWRIRNGRLYTETAAEASGRKWTVPCEYGLVWSGHDAVVFRMTPEGYASMLKSGGGDAQGRCWYAPDDVLHTTVSAGGFTIESESKLEPAKRVNP